MSDFNTTVIEEFRTNNGHVDTAGFGKNLLLVHTVGAKSGEPRVSPLFALPDDGGWLIIGSFAGSPKAPAWVHNLRAHPDSVSVETPGADGVEHHDAQVTEISDDDWDAKWAKFTSASKQFVKYTETAEGRKFPIFRVTLSS
ncbi:nitroreductase family deazaflavin-dependent oxidoreductase [Gordonia jinghuaiqii]|uniref:Nitroreductase family deazaflavin-dependent oxidoreductase n=1 Tax=Gordonia jinghuaiqii TaxID=2758710 RepID=A0A7D7R1X9_9ACTN|nr:nitroreductase/quinone reductase family protein [Gordonia jinghuaiqii]MCR5979406.1 nitroreductase family deazaflavin-dependent oxidoreductase [Gordonia jinghuaiqii]QMT01187.1 nitroreductase family deazaflavin-dependent oxidoreductase [Gordonia jinghuaiqii]